MQDLINEIDLCQRIKWFDYDLAGSLYWRGHEAYDTVCLPPPPAHLGARRPASLPPPTRLVCACCGHSHSATRIRTPRSHTIRSVQCACFVVMATVYTHRVAVVAQAPDDTASYHGCAAPSLSTPASRTATCDTGARTSSLGVGSASTCRSDPGQLEKARVSSSCPAPPSAVRTGGASGSGAHKMCVLTMSTGYAIHLSSLSASRLCPRRLCVCSS